MKNVDAKSVLIGILLAAICVVAIAARADEILFRGRYQLFGHAWKMDRPDEPLIASHDGITAMGVFKIDSLTGKVWVLGRKKSVERTIIEAWVPLTDYDPEGKR
jgi:hypothetical protein